MILFISGQNWISVSCCLGFKSQRQVNVLEELRAISKYAREPPARVSTIQPHLIIKCTIESGFAIRQTKAHYGSRHWIISISDIHIHLLAYFQKYKLRKSSVHMTTYGSEPLSVLGEFEIDVCHGEKKAQLLCIVSH